MLKPIIDPTIGIKNDSATSQYKPIIPMAAPVNSPITLWVKSLLKISSFCISFKNI